jgi:FPC/CPF motif-containing protein YcgG|tara:strand:+ start:213 stop:473 length:261 start_codon:yes stop_codon:yes gene_type:complete
MQKKTRSIFEELDGIYTERYKKLEEREYVVESRASNVIASAVRLMEQIEQLYDAEQAENLHRKLLNAIRLRDPNKFSRSVRRTNEK